MQNRLIPIHILSMLKLSCSFQQHRSLQDYVGVTNATVYQF